MTVHRLGSALERMPGGALAARIVAAWQALSLRWQPAGLIVAVWALLCVPLIFFRGFNSDEGVAATIARTALEDDWWLTPHVFNALLAERPTLLSWIIAGISLPFGEVTQVTARIPVALFLLGGALLIYYLLRRLNTGIPAAVIGTMLFLACPLVLRSAVMVTADMPLGVVLFLAFVLWWDGHQRGQVTWPRWIAVGAVLAAAGMLKGPQPIAYFALGVGVYLLGARSWRELPGFVLAGILCAAPLVAWYAYTFNPTAMSQWLHFMRLGSGGTVLSPPPEALAKLFVELLPAALFALLYPLAHRLRRASPVPGFTAALSCYAFIASLVILFWPGGSTARYYFPMVPAVCVFGGLAYDVLAARYPRLVAPGVVLTAALIGYGIVYSLLSPFLPGLFRASRLDATAITEQVQARPATIYRVGAVGLNEFVYVPGPIRSISLTDIEKLSGPAWIAVDAADAERLVAQRPNRLKSTFSFGRDDQWRLLYLSE